MKLLDSATYVCIEGVIGAGKTSLTEILAERFMWKLMREEFESNPFLTDFYRDRRSVAFQTELWFLLQRYRQIQNTIPEMDLFYPVVVSDYIFMKQRIFSMINLDENEQMLFSEMESTLIKNIPLPEFVIYLRASTETLMQRIAQRNRDFERSISEEYIGRLNESYDEFFRHYTLSPLCVINTDGLDFVNNQNAKQELIEVIQGMEGDYFFYDPEKGRDGDFLMERGME